MAIIYSVHYITGANEAAREAAVRAAYRLAHTVHNSNSGTSGAGTDLNPTIMGDDAITADGWYVIKIDTLAVLTGDRQATAELLSKTADGIGGVNNVWLDGHAVGREYPLTAFGGADEYIIARSFSDDVDGTGHTDTVVTTTDSGANIFRFRSGVKIGVHEFNDGTLKIGFGANTHKALLIQNAASAKFKIGNGDAAVELTLGEFLDTLATGTGEKSDDTTAGVYVVDANLTTKPTKVGGLPIDAVPGPTYSNFITYVKGNPNERRIAIRTADNFASRDSRHDTSSSFDFEDGLPDEYWAYVTIGPSSFTVREFTPERVAGGVPELIVLEAEAAGQTRTLFAGGGKDEYLITSGFSEMVDADTKITIADVGRNIFHFNNTVEISRIEVTDDGAFEISLIGYDGMNDSSHNALRIENAAAARFILGRKSTFELTPAQFLGIVEPGAASGTYEVVKVTAAPASPSMTEIPDPPLATSLFFWPAGVSDEAAAWFIARNKMVIGPHTPAATTLPGFLQDDKWYRLTYNPLDDTLEVILAENAEGHGQGSSRADAVWLTENLAGQTTTLLGASGLDTYFITSEFSASAAMNDGPGANSDTHVTITDLGANIYRFRDDVIIKSAVLDGDALEITFGSGTAPGLTINNTAGTFRLGSENDVALTAQELVRFIREQDGTYTVDDMLDANNIPPEPITFMSESSNDSVAIGGRAVNRDAEGTLTIITLEGTELRSLTHSDATYGEFTYTANTQNTGGAWTYTIDEADRDTLRLRSPSLTETATFTETITITATDDNGDRFTHDVEITIDVRGEVDRDISLHDLSDGQGTVIIHGVLLTFRAIDEDRNNIPVDVIRGDTNEITVLDNHNAYILTLAEEKVITPESLKELWDADSNRTQVITATIIDPDIPDVTIDQIAGRYLFRGGEDDGDLDTAGRDKEVTLDWMADNISANEALIARGRLAILDPEDAPEGSTVEVAKDSTYGDFTIPMTGTGAYTIPDTEPAVTIENGIFDWSYTLDPTDADTRALTGGGAPSTPFYDIITLKVEDKDGGISFHDIPIAITVTGEVREVSITIGAGDAAMTHRESGASTPATTTLTENPESTGADAYAGEVILGNITAAFFIGADARAGTPAEAIVPTIDAASLALGFVYDATGGGSGGGRIIFNGRIDYEAITDADTTAAGVQHRITLTAHKAGGGASGGDITTTHDVLVTIANADDAPMIDSDNITTGTGVTAAEAAEINALNVTLPGGADPAALYYVIDEVDTRSEVLFTIPATDADTGDTLTYSLAASDANGVDVSGNFTIDAAGAVSLGPGGAGAVGAGAVLNHEARAYIRLDVTATSTSTLATDNTMRTATQQVILIINDAEEPLAFIPGARTKAVIPEDTDGTTIPFPIGTFGATDPDEKDAGVDVTYSLDAASEAAGFMIDAGTGKITYIGTGLTRADAAEYTLTITATLGQQTATHDVTVTVTSQPPEPIIDETITYNSGEGFVFTRRQLNANDPDTGDDMLTYTLVEFTFDGDPIAAFETYNTTDETWDALAADGTGTFTQAQVEAGHVRLIASGDGRLSLWLNDGETTVPLGIDPDMPRASDPAYPIAFRARAIEPLPPSTEIGGAGNNGVLDLSGDSINESKSVTTGIGHTTIRLGAGNDEVDAGLGDDAIDLGPGGAMDRDVVIYHFGTDPDGNVIAWSGGDSITGFTPGEDRLLVSDVGGGGGDDDAAFIDGLETGGFIATLATEYTGSGGGNSGDRASLNNYNVTGLEIHFAQAVVLPGGVLGGAVLSITFNAPIAWADMGTEGTNDHIPGFNSMWLGGAAGPGEATPFDTDELIFNNNAAGKAALTEILSLLGPGADIPVEAARSVAVGDDGDNAISTADESGVARAGEWVIFGGGGDDIITLGADTPPPTGGDPPTNGNSPTNGNPPADTTPPAPDTEDPEEIIYRLTIDDSNAITAAPDGSDEVSGFDLGTDRLTFVDTDRTPPTATAATNDAPEISAVDKLMAAIGAAGAVSLAFDNNATPDDADDDTYTGISFGIIADSDPNDNTDDSVTLQVTFAEALTAAELAGKLGSTIADTAALDTIFAERQVGGTPETGQPTKAGTYALNTAGLALIDTLFGSDSDGDALISIGATLPPELL